MKRSREPEEDLSPPTPSTASDDQDSTVSEAAPEAAPAAAPEEAGLPRSKFTEIDPDQEDADVAPTMTCLLHKERLTFQSYDDYESHYNKVHLNRCLECRRNFPSPHLLSVHIEECHDSFVALKREKGEHTYSCFVEGCERKCATPDKRRRHLIDKHMYPKNFFFSITRDGIDGRRSLLEDGSYRHRRKASSSAKEARRRSSLSAAGTSHELDGRLKAGTAAKAAGAESASREGDATTEDTAPAARDVDMDDLAGAMSALTFIPSSIRFGRGRGKAGFSRWSGGR